MSKSHRKNKSEDEEGYERKETPFCDSIKPFSLSIIKGDQGPMGDMGFRGHPGKHGKQGKRGHQGKHGKQGSQGEHGQPGPAGSAGPEGLAGPQGPAGTSGMAAYAFGQNTTEQILNLNEHVVFIPKVLNPGITYDSTLNQFILISAGVYSATYYINSANATEIGLRIDGNILEESVYAVSAGVNTGQVMFTTLTDNVPLAVVSLLSSVTIMLTTSVPNSTQQGRNVSIIIVRMS